MKKLFQYCIFLTILLFITPGQGVAETIDVLIVYTPEALTRADDDDILRWGVEAINAKIDFMVSEANKIFRNSGIYNHELRLVGRRMIDHNESNDLQRELNRLGDFDHFNSAKLNGFNLELIEADTVDELPDQDYGSVFIAFIHTDLHIRIFDTSGEMVVDKPEDELISGENLTALKQLLTTGTDILFPDTSDYTPNEITKILEYVNSVAPHPLDGKMDMAHKWRNEVGADLVNLITATNGGAIGGVARGIYNSEDGFSDHKGFFVNDLSFEYVQGILLNQIGMLFTHELGHILGCNHYRWEVIPPSPPNIVYEPYAYAHKFWDGFVPFGTIMATPDLAMLSIPRPQFSNPDIWAVYVPTGTSDANNARVIKETAPIVASYREAVFPDDSIWVDIEHAGYEVGTVTYPYNTVHEGIAYVTSGGTIVFEKGSDSWTGTISKPMTITAGVGEMVIGK